MSAFGAYLQVLTGSKIKLTLLTHCNDVDYIDESRLG